MYYLYVGSTHRCKNILPKFSDAVNPPTTKPPSLTCHPFFCINRTIKRHGPLKEEEQNFSNLH